MRAQDSTPAWANKKGHKNLSEQYRSQRQKCPRSRKSYSVASAPATTHRNSESLHAEYYGSQSGAIPRRKPPPTAAAFAAPPPGRLPHCPRRPPHRSSLSAPWPFCPSLTAGSHRLCPALRTTEVPSRRETRNRSSLISCKLPLRPFPKDASLFALSVRHRSTPALRTGTFPVSFPVSLQSLFALLMQVPELSSAPVFGIPGGQEEMLSQL
jgi:hypothetical protein